MATTSAQSKNASITLIPIRYRFTFWQYAKLHDGFISINEIDGQIQIFDTKSRKELLSCKIQNILYGFAGKNYIIMGNDQRFYIEFKSLDSLNDSDKAVGMLVVAGAAGTLIGGNGLSTLASGVQTAGIYEHQDRVRFSSENIVLQNFFNQFGAKKSAKPGKLAVRTTYSIACAAILIIFTPSMLHNLIYFIAVLAILIFMVICFELGSQ